MTTTNTEPQRLTIIQERALCWHEERAVAAHPDSDQWKQDGIDTYKSQVRLAILNTPGALKRLEKDYLGSKLKIATQPGRTV